MVRARTLRVTGLVLWPPVQALPDASRLLSFKEIFECLKFGDLLTVARLYISLPPLFPTIF